MKQVLKKYINNGIGFSKNGHDAFLRGEKPEFMFPEGTVVQSTEKHHIEIKVSNTYRRPLVMFYKEIK